MLEVNGVSKRFGHVQALNGLSFTAQSGSITGFLGPNGAGKTTAMRVIMGIERVDTGFVRWNRAPITDRSRRRVGYLPEERGLYPRMRVGEQLSFFAQLRGLSEKDANAKTDFWLDRLHLGKRRDERTDSLSLGTQQRLQLGVALVHQPDLLMLDEPFSGVDPIGVDLMAAALRTAADDGAAVVFSSHQLDLVENLCDSVTILDAGRAVVRGDVARLRKAGRRRYLVQFEQSVSRDWLDQFPDVRIERDENSTLVLQVPDNFDTNRLAQSAIHAGNLVQFRALQPTLEELFRAAVASKRTTLVEELPSDFSPASRKGLPTVRRAGGWNPLQVDGTSSGTRSSR